MESVYGAISVFGIATLVTGLTQAIKVWRKWVDDKDNIKILCTNLLWNLAWLMSWHLITKGVTALTIYEGLFYSFLATVTSVGIYATGKATGAAYQAVRQAAIIAKLEAPAYTDDPPE